MTNIRRMLSRKILLVVLTVGATMAATGVHAGEAEITLKSGAMASQSASKPAPSRGPKSDITLKRGNIAQSNQPNGDRSSDQTSAGNSKPGQTPGSVQEQTTGSALLLPAVQANH